MTIIELVVPHNTVLYRTLDNYTYTLKEIFISEKHRQESIEHYKDLSRSQGKIFVSQIVNTSPDKITIERIAGIRNDVRVGVGDENPRKYVIGFTVNKEESDD